MHNCQYPSYCMPEEANIPFMPEEDPDRTEQKCIRTGSSLSLVNITANMFDCFQYTFCILANSVLEALQLYFFRSWRWPGNEANLEIIVLLDKCVH